LNFRKRSAISIYPVLAAVNETAYVGLVLDDHVPFINNDTRWGHTARAHVFGYLRGLVKMMEVYE
jgi:mannonate dehydratase